MAKRHEGISDEFALKVRSVYMRLWVARQDEKPYLAKFIDADTLSALFAHGHVECVGVSHVRMTDEGAMCYALACEYLLTKTKDTYENTVALRKYLAMAKGDYHEA